MGLPGMILRGYISHHMKRAKLDFWFEIWQEILRFIVIEELVV